MISAIFQRNHDVTRGIYWRSAGGLATDGARCKDLQGVSSIVGCVLFASPESAPRRIHIDPNTLAPPAAGICRETAGMDQ